MANRRKLKSHSGNDPLKAPKAKGAREVATGVDNLVAVAEVDNLAAVAAAGVDNPAAVAAAGVDNPAGLKPNPQHRRPPDPTPPTWAGKRKISRTNKDPTRTAMAAFTDPMMAARPSAG
jgi:hypothetical protein